MTFHRIPKVSTGRGRRTEKLTAKRRRLWLAKVGRKNWNPSDNARICSAHFVLGKTYKKDWSGQSHIATLENLLLMSHRAPSSLYDENHPDWVPTRLLGYGTEASPEPATARYLRSKARKLSCARSDSLQDVQDTMPEYTQEDVVGDDSHYPEEEEEEEEEEGEEEGEGEGEEEEEEEEEVECQYSVGCQTDVTVEDAECQTELTMGSMCAIFSELPELRQAASPLQDKLQP